MDFPSLRELLRRTGVAALAVAALALFLYPLVVGRWLRLGFLSRGDLVPWYAQWDPRVGVWTLVGGAVAGLVVVRGVPRILRTRSTARGLALLLGSALILWIAVAATDGAKVGESRDGLVPTNALAYPFERTAHEYIGDVGKVEALGVTGLLSRWHRSEVQETLAWHSRTHPPGAVLLLGGVERTLGGGPTRAALAVLLLGALALLPAWGWARMHLSPQGARVALLAFLAAPSTTLFFATSMEAVFTLTMTTALWAMCAGLAADRGRRRVGLSLLGGAALALSTFFTYASLLVVFVVVALEGTRLVRNRRGTAVPGRDHRSFDAVALSLAVQLVGFGAVVGGLAALGWDPVASVRAAIVADATMMPAGGGIVGWLGTGIANLLAWAIGAGVATLAMLGSIAAGRRAVREREGAWAVVGVPDLLIASGIALGVAAFSTLFTLEVERIWIPMTLPVLVGLVATLERESDQRPSVSSSGRPARPPWSRTRFVQAWVGLLVLQSLLTEILAEMRW